jgi:hypothetical protein
MVGDLPSSLTHIGHVEHFPVVGTPCGNAYSSGRKESTRSVEGVVL